MAIPSNRPQNRILLVGGIVFALLAGVVAFIAISKGTGSTVGPSVNVYVAAQDIPAGTALTPDMITQVSLPQNAAPADGIVDKAQIAGKTAPILITIRTPITQSLLNAQAGPGGTGINTAHLNITKGDVALAIPAKGTTQDTTVDQMTVGYYIQPEDHIDILIDAGGPTASDHALRYAFQDVRVLRVGTTTAPAAAAAGTPVVLSPPAFFIIELPRNQAEMMVALISGKFAAGNGGAGNPPVIMKYVLRPVAENGTKDKDGNYAPKYEPSTGVALPGQPDQPVTPSSLASSFPG